MLTPTGITTVTSIAVPADLAADRLAQSDDCVLGRAVGRAAGDAGLAGARGDVDQVAAARAGGSAASASLEPKITPVQVDVDHPLGHRVGLLDERPDRHDPGVVDQHVERSEALLDLVQEALEARAIGDVERQPDRAAAESPARSARRAPDSMSPIATRAPCVISAGGGRAADSPRAAGDRDDLPGERAWSS